MNPQTVTDHQYNHSAKTYVANIASNLTSDDYYICEIWDVTVKPYNVIAQYRDNNRSNEYNEQQTVALITEFKPSITAVQTNGGGTIILDKLKKKFPNIRFEPVLITATNKWVNWLNTSFS